MVHVRAAESSCCALLLTLYRYPDEMAWQVKVKPASGMSTKPLSQFIMQQSACVSSPSMHSCLSSISVCIVLQPIFQREVQTRFRGFPVASAIMTCNELTYYVSSKDVKH